MCTLASNPADLKIHAVWFIGDDRQKAGEEGFKTPIYKLERSDVIRTMQEFAVPADAVSEDRYLAVGFQNLFINSRDYIMPFILFVAFLQKLLNSYPLCDQQGFRHCELF